MTEVFNSTSPYTLRSNVRKYKQLIVLLRAFLAVLHFYAYHHNTIELSCTGTKMESCERMPILFTFLFGLGFLCTCYGFGSGTPPNACGHMIPLHYFNYTKSLPLSPQNGSAPFEVKVNKQKFGKGTEVEGVTPSAKRIRVFQPRNKSSSFRKVGTRICLSGGQAPEEGAATQTPYNPYRTRTVPHDRHKRKI
ncbi:hypothetical protein HOLleu_31016 [Holothuria leucospilota]|uniref:Transmembrane protein n=1 Tax=Holothuria leucospilota TaxID=206669 RepID=A0A9Q1BLC9_HOLLE|nr:hypothetical protein HOLleu_31016 [Holothuria leucospilota]